MSGIRKTYPAYKDSGVEWIGEIPEGWETKRLKFKFLLKKGLSITKADLCDSGVAVLSYGQIHAKDNNGVHVQPHLKRYLPERYLDTDKECLLPYGSILFADTSEDVSGVGNCIHIDISEDIFAGYHTIMVIPTEKSTSCYLAYLFQTDVWRAQLRSRASGIKVFSITQDLIKECMLLLPPLPEQQAIADYLDAQCSAIDSQKAQLVRSIDLLREYRGSLITHAVTGKIDVREVPVCAAKE